MNKLFSPLLEMLTDHHDSQYDKVVCMALQVVSILSSSRASSNKSEPASAATSATTTTTTTTTEVSPRRAKGKDSPKLTTASSGKAQHQQLPPPAPLPRPNNYFHRFMVELLKMFDSDRTLLENKGSFIIR